MFYGRKSEIAELSLLKKKTTASLVCILGRRRIGKSRLIQEFAKSYDHFYSFQGLGPDNNAGLREQLDHFAYQLSELTNKKQQSFNHWAEAFTALAKYVQKNQTLVLFDEISWMARGDQLFASKLKDAWDRLFKQNNKLILVLCGSVSAWIHDNILNNVNFEGRVSSRIELQELDLKSINKFWTHNNYHMGSLEKALILSVTGGVPKYIEEVLSSSTAEKNLIRLCFTPKGLLFNDFSYIFSEVLGRRSENLEKIVRLCLEKKMTPIELSKKLKIVFNSDLTEAIRVLELSGFLSKDYSFKPDGSASQISHLRVKDNYLRFYLKIIEPLSKSIQKGGKLFSILSEIKNFDGILGLQFENLILQNRTELYPLLDLKNSEIISAAPHRQNKTLANKGACQIDLLIHTDRDIFYLCEIKCQKMIDRTIIKDVQQKMDRLALPKRSSLKPVLVYEGEIYPPHEVEIRKYFYRIVHFGELLE